MILFPLISCSDVAESDLFNLLCTQFMPFLSYLSLIALPFPLNEPPKQTLLTRFIISSSSCSSQATDFRRHVFLSVPVTVGCFLRLDVNPRLGGECAVRPALWELPVPFCPERSNGAGVALLLTEPVTAVITQRSRRRCQRFPFISSSRKRCYKKLCVQQAAQCATKCVNQAFFFLLF